MYFPDLADEFVVACSILPVVAPTSPSYTPLLSTGARQHIGPSPLLPTTSDHGRELAGSPPTSPSTPVSVAGRTRRRHDDTAPPDGHTAINQMSHDKCHVTRRSQTVLRHYEVSVGGVRTERSEQLVDVDVLRRRRIVDARRIIGVRDVCRDPVRCQPLEQSQLTLALQRERGS